MELTDNFSNLLSTVFLLVFSAGLCLQYSGVAPAKNAGAVFTNSAVAGLFSVLGLVCFGAILLFKDGSSPLDLDPLGLWDGSLTDDNFGILSQMAALVVLLSIIPTGVTAGRMQWGGTAFFGFITGSLLFPVFSNLLQSKGLTAGSFSASENSLFIGFAFGAVALSLALVCGAREGKFYTTSGGEPAITFTPEHNLPFVFIGSGLILFGGSGYALLSALNRVGDASFTPIYWPFLIIVLSTPITLLLMQRIIHGAFNPSLFCASITGGLITGLTTLGHLSAPVSLLAGVTAGIIIFAGNLFFEKIKVDDASNTITSHLLCGLSGIFFLAATKAIGWLLTGQVILLCLATGLSTFFLFLAIKRMGLLIPSSEDQRLGLDFTQHGQNSYPPSDS